MTHFRFWITKENTSMKVQLFVTCLVDSIFPDVGDAVVDVLERAGVEVAFPAGQTCCGQPAFNAGYWDEARQMALHIMNVFETTEEPLVIPSGSCADMVKHRYPELFRDDPPNLARAHALSERTYELSQFLVDVLGVKEWDAFSPQILAYHPSCHLLRGMGVDRQPKDLLRAAGADLVELEAECCGFGGVFSVDYARISAEMLKRKIAAIEASGAQVVVAGDVSCLMHIEGGLRRAGSKIRCAHVAQVLAGRVLRLTGDKR
jgi:L-lactate dehydrogenase complex protein LldE